MLHRFTAVVKTLIKRTCRSNTKSNLVMARLSIRTSEICSNFQNVSCTVFKQQVSVLCKLKKKDKTS